MKSWITTLAVAAIAFLGATPNAEARQHRHRHAESYIYVSGYRSCGTPIYSERYLVGYDRWGHPIWKHRKVKAPRHYRRAPQPRYYAAPVCPPPARPYYGGYRDSGVVIQGTIRL